MNELLIEISRLAIVLLLVLLNGFFVAAEFSLVSVRKTRIEELAAGGDAAAKVVRKAIADPDSVIAATQLGITLASLGLGWVGEPALEGIIAPVVGLLPESIAGTASHSISAVIAFVIITTLHVVVGELAPKSIALQYPESTSLAVGRPTIWAETLFKPFILVLNGTGNGLLRLLGVDRHGEHGTTYSRQELKMLVEASAEGGVLRAHEQDMLEAVFDLREMTARQVLVPRTEMQTLHGDQTLRDLVALPSHQIFNRFPIYDESQDNIVGILHIRDTLAYLAEGKLDTPLRDLVRPTIFVPESASVSGVMAAFREARQHTAIVLDEFGGTEGMVTLEDILEEISGDLPDEDEVAIPDVVKRPDGTILVNGLTLISDINEELDMSLDDPNYDTIAGYVMGRLDRIPEMGDEVKIEGVIFRVLAMDGKRIARLQARKAGGA